MKEKRAGEALSLVLHSVERFPQNIRVLLLLAQMYIENGKHEKAETTLRLVIQKDDKNIEGWYLLAETLQTLGRSGSAKNAALKASTLLAHRPADSENAPMRLRLALIEGRWGEASQMLEAHLRSHPSDWTSHRDLAEAYAHLGQWKKAMTHYEMVPSLQKKGLGVDVALKELSETYDSRVKAAFELVDLGADAWEAVNLQGSAFVGEPWQIAGVVQTGHYASPSINFEGTATKGNFRVSYHHNPRWIFTAGAGFGVSDARTTVSPLAELSFKPADAVTLKAGYAHRELRTDLPQAVGAGDLQDTAFFDWNSLFFARFIFEGRYDFNRDTLPDGSQAFTQSIEPRLSAILFKKPYVTVGYQYHFLDVSDAPSYLRKVPLIPRTSSHYLTGSIEQKVGKNFSVDGNFFIGEDTARRLHFVEGDLLGAGAGFRWNVTRHVDLNSSYFYGKETLTTAPGQSHSLNMGIAGHW